MKRQLSQRILAAILAAGMLVGLAACGGSDTAAESETTQTSQETQTATATSTTAAEEEAMGYVASYPSLGVDMDWYSSCQVRGDKAYVFGTKWSAEEGSAELIAVLDGEGNLVNSISFPQSGNRSLTTITVGNDYLLAAVYEWREAPVFDTASEDTTDWDDDAAATDSDDDWLTTGQDEDVPDGWASTSGDAVASAEEAEETDTETEETDDTEWIYEEANVVGQAYYGIAKYDMNGQLLSEREITPPEDSDWFYIEYLCVDDDDNIYYSCDQTIYLLDSDLNSVGSVTADNWITSMFCLPDGSVGVSYWSNGGRALATIDFENQTLGDALSLSGGSYLYYYSVGMDGCLYGFNDSYLYRFDMETGEGEQVMYFLDWDVNGNNLNGSLLAMTNGNFLCFGYDSNGNAEATLLQQVPLSQIKEKIEITLGCSYLDYDVQEKIMDFNKNNDTYRIVVKDYSEYVTDDNWTAGYDQLDQDILAGSCPDILVMDNLSADKYIAKGILTDLYTLMSADTYEKSDFIPSYLNVMEENGSLYTISSNFNINTLVGAKSYVGESSEGWTMEAFLAAVEKLPEDGLILDYMTRDGFLTTMLNLNSDLFIDSETGQCSFDSQEFINLLNACTVFPTDNDAYEEFHIANGTSEGWSNDSAYYNARYDELRTGQMLLMSPDIWGVWTLRFGMMSGMGDDIVFVGYPDAPGNGTVISPSTEYAISASSAYQDVAWQFLCAIMDPEGMSDFSNFSVLQAGFDQQMEQVQERSYYLDDNGEKVYTDSESDKPLTAEEAATLRSLVDGAACRSRYDEQVTSIVTEEAAAFFSGQKTAEAVADLIQNRVQIYLDEQR